VRLQALIQVLLEAGGFTAAQELSEARALWAAVDRESPRMHTPFDEAWFAGLIAAREAPLPGRHQHALHTVRAEALETFAPDRTQDWGEAPDTAGFVGRDSELALLRASVVEEPCRLVALLGMAGIGKTTLAARLAQNVASNFGHVYWRSLRDAPPLSEWLAGAIGFLSDQHIVPPSTESERITALLQLLRDQPCLLVLDNWEILFEPGEREGRYRSGVTGYGQLLRAVGDASHQSCLVLTSREAPAELAVLVGGAERTFHLGGFGVEDAQVLLAPKRLDGTPQQWAEFTARLGGNGLALKVVGETIRELFDGDVGSFLDQTGASSTFGGMRRLLAAQVGRSSALEQQVLRVLVVEREPLSLAALLADMSPRFGRGDVLEAVEALRRRSLLERAEVGGPAAFTLQSVVLEYLTDRLVEGVAEEIERGQPMLLVERSPRHPIAHRLADLPGVLIATANQAQGLEREAVVVIQPLAGYREAPSFATDPGRLCVALSRHRTHATVIVDRNMELVLRHAVADSPHDTALSTQLQVLTALRAAS
jgi:hypothetical protein